MNAIFKLPRAIWILGLVSFFNDLGSELVYPVLPLYISSVLMAGPKALGIIEGVAEASGSLLKLFSGIFADRFRSAKWLVFGGYAIASVSRPLLALAASWPFVVFLRFMDRVGKGIRTSPRDAMLALSAEPHQRGLAFGFHRSLDNAGAVLGPLLAAWLLAEKMPLRDVILFSAVFGFAALFLVLLVKEPHRELTEKRGFSWNFQDFPISFKRYLCVLALFTLGNSSNMFLLLRAKEMGLADYQVPLLWALVSFFAMLFSAPFSALSDRIGRTALIVSGWGIYGLFYLFMGLNGKILWLLWPLFAFYGLFMAATEGAEKALVADLAPPDKMGTAYGWFHLTSGIMLLPASVLFGFVWQNLGPRFAFSLSAFFALLASILLKCWVLKKAS